MLRDGADVIVNIWVDFGQQLRKNEQRAATATKVCPLPAAATEVLQIPFSTDSTGVNCPTPSFGGSCALMLDFFSLGSRSICIITTRKACMTRHWEVPIVSRDNARLFFACFWKICDPATVPLLSSGTERLHVQDHV
ncbi:hypothetical protein M3J09_002176 [Ascochyta lentis]